VARQWAIKIQNGNEDRGWLFSRSLTIAVYDNKDFAEKEAEWLTNFQKKCGTKNQYKVVKWTPEEGVQTELQMQDERSLRKSQNSVTISEHRKKSEEKKSKPVIPESSGVAPTLPTNLSELFIGNLDTDGTP
jgi:hypothetical protein